MSLGSTATTRDGERAAESADCSPKAGDYFDKLYFHLGHFIFYFHNDCPDLAVESRYAVIEELYFLEHSSSARSA